MWDFKQETGFALSGIPLDPRYLWVENGVQGSSAGRPGAVGVAQVRDGGWESGGSRGEGQEGHLKHGIGRLLAWVSG